MRLIRLIIFLILASLAIPALHAANQTEICKAQCAAYEMAWQDDYCYQFVKEMCSKGDAETGLEMADFWASMVESEASYWIFVSAYACVDVIDECIAPINDACARYCEGNNLGYAPDLTVSRLYYLKDTETLQTTIANRGLAYIEGAYATAYFGYSDSVNDTPHMTMIDEWDVPALRPPDVRWSPEDLNFDYSHNIEYPIMKGKYNVFKVFVHGDPRYNESSMDNNALTYVVNDLPPPGELRFRNVTATRVAPSSVSFNIVSIVENAGGVTDDAVIRYYVGAPNNPNPAFQSPVSVWPNYTITDRKNLTYDGPGQTMLTVRLEKDGRVIGERTLFLVPQFFKFTGFVKDEAGRPVANATVEAGYLKPGVQTAQGGYILSETRISTQTDDDGGYSFDSYLTREGTAYLTTSKPGYVVNVTEINLSFNDSADYGFDDLRYIHADIVLQQQPVELFVQYPSNGKYLIQTDKGRYSGDFLYGRSYVGSIPVAGANGTILISSRNCTPFISSFTAQVGGTNLSAQHITCPSPDIGDDYSVRNDTLLWEKTYSGEEPREVAFDRRGDHAYVMAVDNDDNHCTVYAYDLVTGNQQYSIRFNSSSCGGRSRMVPSYDGSFLFVAVGAVKLAKTGDTVPKGFVIARNGTVVASFDISQTAETLDLSSASEFLDIIDVEQPLFYLRGNETIESCRLILNRTCNPPSGLYAIKQFGLSHNRVLGTCDNQRCIFTPGFDDYRVLGGSYSNSEAASNYANDDVFLYNYQGGSYYTGTTKSWSASGNVERASISPGGRFIAVSYDSHGLELFDASGTSLVKQKDTMPIGVEATERGIFYAKNLGPKVEIHALTTLSEPTSLMGGVDRTGSATFIDQLLQTVFDYFNGFMAFLRNLFGL
ncbi:carboxypeptidase regulatory-like domain-containing protein [Candidatus Micrarchaeota archaeon]|nr:carboxypeptidase regulatory-like domain-containing protein [Candidatus Micrarchaeota archaeon]